MIEKNDQEKKKEKGKNGYRFSFTNDSQILPLRLTGNNAINFQLCSVNPLLEGGGLDLILKAWDCFRLK